MPRYRINIDEVERLRLAKRVSKAALCRAAGIAYSTYKYAQNGRNVRQLVALGLADALDVPVEQIATPVDEPDRLAS